MRRERVAAWRARGKSAAEFCSGQEFAAKSLQWWAWHFGAKKSKKRAATPKPRFARVVTKRDVKESKSDASVVVLVGGARIEICHGADRGTGDQSITPFRRAREAARDSERC